MDERKLTQEAPDERPRSANPPFRGCRPGGGGVENPLNSGIDAQLVKGAAEGLDGREEVSVGAASQLGRDEFEHAVPLAPSCPHN